MESGAQESREDREWEAREDRAREDQSDQEREETRHGRRQDIERRSGASLPIRRGGMMPRPFSVARQFGEDLDRMFDRAFGDLFENSLFRWADWPQRLWYGSPGEAVAPWPELEVQQRDGKLVIRADVPGLRREDLTLEVRGQELCISGERRIESERREGRYYRSERRYGSFRRLVPLPAGVKPETASASFENGVLEIEMEAPERQQQRIEIREGSPH